MFIYNDNTQLFLRKVRLKAQDIFAGIGLDFKRQRLYRGAYSYPLSFVVNESDSVLGFYDPLIYQIGINKYFMSVIDTNDELLENVLKHEIAHFLVHIECGVNEQAHGVEFRSIFNRYGWDQTFSKSQINLEKFVKANDGITAKIKKLLELAKSDNENEARVATKKANDLIKKHNLQSIRTKTIERGDIDYSNLEDTYVKRVASYKRRSLIHDCLYEIIKEFSVAPVFSSGRGGGYLEVIGSKENVESAHYIYDFTMHAMERQWLVAKKNANLKGVRAKHSFYKSFTKSYLNELKSTKAQGISSKELVHLNTLSRLHKNRVYPRTSAQSSSATSFDPNAWKLGASAGKNFKISQGINGRGQTKLLSQ